MYIQRLRLSQFRNYEKVDCVPARGVTVLHGENAQGKTNLLEAIHLCCVGRSHRTARDAELVRFGSPMAQVAAQVQSAQGAQEIVIRLMQKERKKKEVRINQTPIKRIGELMGHLNVVLFSPEDLRLVKDGPEGRRRFVDMGISQQYPAYFYALQRYHRALLQRNELLKKIARSPSGAWLSSLEEWDALLVETGMQVIERRRMFLAQLTEVAQRAHAELSGGKERLEMRYTSRIENARGFAALLHAARAEDQRRMTTSVGPHRDDFLLHIAGKEARAFASQGQQRTAALSLKLAEIEVMKANTKKDPILLLDDVMSELDVPRRNMLLSAIGNVQTFITCTHLDDLGGAPFDCAYRVQQGTLMRV